MAGAPLLFDLDFLTPGQMVAPRIVGGAIDGGVSNNGVATSSDASGGGLVAVDYSSIYLGNTIQGRMRFFNRIAGSLSGGVRQIVVPLLTDFIAPVDISSIITATTFSDGSAFYQPPVAGIVTVSGIVNDATITVSVIGGTGKLEGGEWFGLNHPTKSFRAYMVTDIDSVTQDGHGNNVYKIGIRPTLRDTIAAGATVDWWRPRCLMRLSVGFAPDLNVEKFWFATPSLKFVEAF